ncbi:MAG: class II aldolase/adducin family protein [Oscillospiraceae bacterium]|jgi:L-fuculose-phosphate aldolase|nr:class II aldolase/adducin family protein [Oscillospiraceae bacterium]
MDILEAKLAVIAAGKRLVETGLIARTWGNVSARVDDKQFVITPSGKAYDGLTPDDIVLVNIFDLAYDGEVKPSSEKGIHAQAYALRPQVNFVIHTHQRNASIAAVMGRPVASPYWSDVLGETVPIAAYGLPGTGKLKKGVTKALKEYPGANAVLMAHHGALCVGKDAEAAFQVADALEKACLAHLKSRLTEVTGEVAETLEGIHALIDARRAQPTQPAPILEAYTSFRSGAAFCMEGRNGTILDVSLANGKVAGGLEPPETLELHRTIYQKNHKINAIVHSQQPDIIRASKARQKLLPFLDDFAQIAGINLRLNRYNPNSQLESAALAAKALKGRSALLLEDNGALCVGTNLEEARAVETVTEKNCAVSLSADLFDKVRHIGVIDALLMRTVYVLKYSKKK